MKSETQVRNDERELTDAELNQVAGGDSMDLIAQAYVNWTNGLFGRLMTAVSGWSKG